MSPIDRINAVADVWVRFCVDGMVQGAIALLIVSLVWRLIHQRATSQLGYWLFFLVLLKPFVPIQVLVPPPTLVTNRIASSSDVAADIRTVVPQRTSASPVVGSVVGVTSRDMKWSTAAWLMLGWCLTVCLGLARLGWIQARTRRLIRRATPATSAERSDFDMLVRLAGIRRPTRLLWSRTMKSPVAACASSPCVVMPRHLARLLTEQQMRWTLLHELAHVRRGDLWVMLLQSGIRTVLFFNPAIWVASYIVDQLREQSCDDEATSRSSISPTEAGRGFLKIVEYSGSNERVLALGFHDTQRHIRSRMMRLIQTNRTTRYRLTLPAKIAVVAMALVLLPSVKAQENSKDLSIRARIAALEAELKVLKGAVTESDSETDASAATEKRLEKVEVHHVRVHADPSHTTELHQDDPGGNLQRKTIRRNFTVQLSPENRRLVGDRLRQLPGELGIAVDVGLDAGGNHVVLGSHKAKIAVPGQGKQNYDVFDIDTTKMEKPGLLVIKIQLGEGAAAASFDLFPGDISIPSDPEQQEQLRTEKSVAQLYDVPGGHSGTLIYYFKPGDKFKLGASGNWFSDKDATNTAQIEAIGMDFSATIHHHAAEAGDIIGLTRASESVIHVPTPSKGTHISRRRTLIVVPEAKSQPAN